MAGTGLIFLGCAFTCHGAGGQIVTNGSMGLYSVAGLPRFTCRRGRGHAYICSRAIRFGKQNACRLTPIWEGILAVIMPVTLVY
jgi:hypothetical protein